MSDMGEVDRGKWTAGSYTCLLQAPPEITLHATCYMRAGVKRGGWVATPTFQSWTFTRYISAEGLFSGHGHSDPSLFLKIVNLTVSYQTILKFLSPHISQTSPCARHPRLRQRHDEERPASCPAVPRRLQCLDLSSLVAVPSAAAPRHDGDCCNHVR